MNKYTKLQQFRLDTYQMFVKAKDATFELMDSIMTTANANSIAEFSLSPLFHRKWSSTYEAIEDSRFSTNKLMKRCIQEIPPQPYILLGLDHIYWQFQNAVTLKELGYQYHRSSINSSILGLGYSTIAWLPELADDGSWTLPLRHERITSFENPISKAHWQLKQVERHLPHQTNQLLVADCEYGNGLFLKQTADVKISKLIRVRSNCCLYTQSPAYPGRGRPRRHGHKFKLNDANTHIGEDEMLEIEDDALGLIRISQWKNLHFRNAYAKRA